MGRYDHDMPVFTSDGRGGAKKRPASTTGTTPKRRWEPRTAGAETEAWINADIPGGEKVQEQLAATKRWQEMERHHVDRIMTSGMTAPTFIRTDTNVRAMQGALGVKEDGVWGPETDAAFTARLAQEEAAAVAELQRLYREAGGTRPQERYYKQSRIDPEIVGKYMQAGERDEDRASTSTRRPPAVVYGTTPRPIPEAAGAVARSMNTLEGINRAYDQIIAEKEAAWRSLDTRGVNPRSQEGRVLMREKGALYTDWKETERAKAKAVAAWYRARNEAAYAQSPDALIDVAVEDARGVVRRSGYKKTSYPHNTVIEGESMMFGSEEELFTYSGSVLNYLTDYSGLEHMCGIYSVDWEDGRIEYISGPVVSGTKSENTANVIIPFVACFISAEAYTASVERVYAGAEVKFEGILHSHPSYGSGESYNNNDNFSWGDGLAAMLSGKIWLTTQDGTMYALDEADTGVVIPAGIMWDALVWLMGTPAAGFVENYWNNTRGGLKAVSEAGRYGTIEVVAYDASRDRR